MISIALVFLHGCSGIRVGDTLVNEKPLSKEELEKKAIGGRLFRDSEEFFLLPNGRLIYVDRETTKKTTGSWYLFSSRENNIGGGMLCVAIGYTNPNEFKGLPCYRFYSAEDEYGNLYLSEGFDCKMQFNGPRKSLQCDRHSNYFGWFRLTSGDESKDKN